MWPHFLRHIVATLAPAWEAQALRSRAASAGVSSEVAAGEAAVDARIDSDDDGEEDDQVTAILQERELRDVTRSLSDLLVLIFNPRQHLGAGASTQPGGPRAGCRGIR